MITTLSLNAKKELAQLIKNALETNASSDGISVKEISYTNLRISQCSTVRVSEKMLACIEKLISEGHSGDAETEEFLKKL